MCDERRKIIANVLKQIQLVTRKGEAVIKKRLCAECSILFGLTTKKTEEYLTDLENAERISILGEEITAISEEERQKKKLDKEYEKAGLP